MATGRLSEVIEHLRRAALLRDEAAFTDGQLLGRFIERRDETAFGALVRRHGPMVWGVCRRLLANHHDAEDAFQATFLVLVRKAASVVPRERVVNWLYGVAHQTALKARATAAKRRRRERQVRHLPNPAVTGRNPGRDPYPDLDRELSRLPEKYRIAIILCDLEGRTRKEAARQLGVPEGTLAARLARGRSMLAKRLTRRNLAVPAGGMAALCLDKAAGASVPVALMSSVIKAAAWPAAGQTVSAGAVGARAAALTEEVLKSMLMTKLKTAAVVLLAAGMVAFSSTRLTGPAAVATAAGAEQREVSRGADPAKAEESLSVQVRIAGPAGMKVSLLSPAQENQAPPVVAPARFNLEQGAISRLKLADIPNHPGVEVFPSIEIPLADSTTEPFVISSAIPVAFTEEDFEQVAAGNFVVKVVYFPDPQFQDLAATGPDEVVSSRLEPGVDPIVEGRRRGAILAVVRVGNIDLGGGRRGKVGGKVRPLKGEGLVRIEIGNDGIQGVVRPLKERSHQPNKDKRVAPLANQVERLMRDVAAVQAENEQLRQRLEVAEREARSLQVLLERKERELQRLKAGKGIDR
jgi:RNA polymerase sigma factor (sigma-70 family)